RAADHPQVAALRARLDHLPRRPRRTGPERRGRAGNPSAQREAEQNNRDNARLAGQTVTAHVGLLELKYRMVFVVELTHAETDDGSTPGALRTVTDSCGARFAARKKIAAKTGHFCLIA